MKRFKNYLVPALATCGMILCNTATADLNISTVSVGNLGNANDSTGFGGVSYVYNIGTYEVTLNQYATFLNAVAATDTYSLYNANMAANVNVAGITRSGVSGSYTYAVTGSGDRPVTYVSWFDAARFVNWLDTGTTETGAYALNGATSGIIGSTMVGSGWRLPTESEWYKAAYGGAGNTYSTYATGANVAPDSRPPNSSFQNSANYYFNDSLGNGYNGGYAVNNSTAQPTGSAITDGGSYTLANSFYGTFDQNGNAAEWTDGVSGSQKVIRGGSWGDSNLSSSSRGGNLPGGENQFTGFRVLDVPEPGVIGSLCLGLAMMAWRMKRDR
jgi:formylglycine-generating enzyme